MMRFGIDVTVGVTEPVEGFLRWLMAGRDAGETCARSAAEPPAEERPRRPRAEPERAAETAPEPSETKGPEKREEPAPAAAAAPEPAGQEKEPGYPTDDDLRKFMDMTISQFCGAGWRDETDPAKMRLRKSCTRAFSEIARHLGTNKPTQISPEKRNIFAAELDRIVLNPERTEVIWAPF